MTEQPLIKCSVNRSIVNKAAPWEWSTVNVDWKPYTGTAVEILDDVIFKGNAVNQSLIPEGEGHKGHVASAGNLVVLDLDEGITFDEIFHSHTYQMWGAFIYPSSSCGVVTDKKGVDGRERWRVGFIMGREFHTDIWTDDVAELRLNPKRQHLERVACTEHLTNNFCSDVGIAKLKDNCHKTVAQPFYGNDGITPIPLKTDDDKRIVLSTYPCSTEKRFHIHNGFLPVEDMDRIIEAYKLRSAEVFEARIRPSDEDQSRAAEIARWVFDNDLLNEDQLTDRDIIMKQVAACARGLGEDSLLDSFMGMMEKVMDGHPWRQPRAIEQSWYRFSEVSAINIGTIIMLADEASPGWRTSCPFMSGTTKTNVFPLSEAFSLMRSIPSVNIIL